MDEYQRHVQFGIYCRDMWLKLCRNHRRLEKSEIQNFIKRNCGAQLSLKQAPFRNPIEPPIENNSRLLACIQYRDMMIRTPEWHVRTCFKLLMVKLGLEIVRSRFHRAPRAKNILTRSSLSTFPDIAENFRPWKYSNFVTINSWTSLGSLITKIFRHPSSTP